MKTLKLRNVAEGLGMHNPYLQTYAETNPIFITRKHPIMNYRTQQRNALKRRRAK